MRPKVYKIEYSEVPVDAGIIQIADYNHYKPYGFKRDSRYLSCSLDHGIYSVNYHIPNAWREDCYGTKWLEVTSGRVLIGDPCYHVSKWMKYLNDTHTKDEEWKDTMPAGAIRIDTSGDGGFRVILEFEKWNQITNYAVRCLEVGDGEQTRLWEDPEHFINGFRDELVPWGIVSTVESLIKKKEMDAINEYLLSYISHKAMHEEDQDRWEYQTWNGIEDWDKFDEWNEE